MISEREKQKPPWALKQIEDLALDLGEGVNDLPDEFFSEEES